jgi:hypothetical protein
MLDPSELLDKFKLYVSKTSGQRAAGQRVVEQRLDRQITVRQMTVLQRAVEQRVVGQKKVGQWDKDWTNISRKIFSRTRYNSRKDSRTKGVVQNTCT